MRLVTWNIRRNAAAFDYAAEVLQADAVFFQESKGIPRVSSFVGEHQNINDGLENRKWGNSNAARLPLTTTRVSLKTSYPGSLVASALTGGDGSKVGVVNMYGLFERQFSLSRQRLVTPGLNRKISEISPWIQGNQAPEVDAFIVLGDWNLHRVMDTRFPSMSRLKLANIFFDRLEELGLTNLIDFHYEFPPQTYKSVRGSYPWQIDHMYVSSHARSSFTKPWVDDSADVDSISDHRPIIVDYVGK